MRGDRDSEGALGIGATLLAMLVLVDRPASGYYLNGRRTYGSL